MKRKSYNLEEMQGIATTRGGKCLSASYINTRTNLEWQCDKGHIWDARPSSVIGGSWCSSCAKQASRRHTIEEMQDLATNRGGKCLSTEYLGNTHKLKWECNKGHVWESSPKAILRGGWCPLCSLNKPEIADIQNIANSRGGKCLSTVFIDHRSKLKWQCNKGHIWESRLSVIKDGSWCPLCSNGMGEHICRMYFERLFNSQFIKVRPKWLISEKGRRLELDGYSQELKIAFEHQGLQHYKHIERYHKINDLQTLQERDKIKVIKCKERGIRLFVMPSIPDLLPLEKVESFIRKEAKRLSVYIPNAKTVNINSLDIYIRQEQLLEVQNIALSKGGRCLSTHYLGSSTKLRWQCDKGHIWEATPSKIKSGNWCAICVLDKKRLTIEEMHDIANSRGGKCLSTEYINSGDKLEWQCDKGHTWKATPNSVKRGNWCIFCTGLARLTIEEMQDIATSKVGKCLSTEYINIGTKLKWQCSKGHEWYMAPGNVKNQGQWCPHCAHCVKLTIEEMHDIAASRGGKCLSTVYINSGTKLKWQCDKGHEWEAIVRDVKTGHWCPYCAGHARLTVEEMQSIAIKRGGKCLSKEYVNSITKLMWQCDKGHEWEATPGAVKRGTWCPACYLLNDKSNL